MPGSDDGDTMQMADSSMSNAAEIRAQILAVLARIGPSTHEKILSTGTFPAGTTKISISNALQYLRRKKAVDYSLGGTWQLREAPILHQIPAVRWECRLDLYPNDFAEMGYERAAACLMAMQALSSLAAELAERGR